MFAVFAVIVFAALVASWIGFARVRSKRGTGPRGAGWAIAHHLVVMAVVLEGAVVSFLPSGALGDPHGGVGGASGLIISAAVISVVLAFLSVAIDAAVTFIENAAGRRTVVVVVWVLTAGLLWLHLMAWLNTTA
ncbi:hypothetical protein [Leifsonia sp. Leaf264]|uniref:hypothetical protein n=1 Tax=Leifsonia sp. Leaf264 TaxID=1736314 RepID=UPI0006F790D0|nr:hypothetical protein [Leifsonia sp. Leaf264]KQO98499.1 hypothetical protein ASF30_10580 [Leifsonia sp. Leaf264]